MLSLFSSHITTFFQTVWFVSISGDGQSDELLWQRVPLARVQGGRTSVSHQSAIQHSIPLVWHPAVDDDHRNTHGRCRNQVRDPATWSKRNGESCHNEYTIWLQRMIDSPCDYHISTYLLKHLQNNHENISAVNIICSSCKTYVSWILIGW